MASNEQGKMKDPLDILSTIQKTEAPPFLYTRIMQQIEKRNRYRAKPALTWAVCASLALVFAINTIIVVSKTKKNEPGLAFSLHLTSRNALYHD